MKVLLAVGCIFWSLIAAEPADSFELDQLLRAPMTTELVSAEGAERLAWVSYEQGRRNVWFAEAPHYIPKQLTAFNKDDGQRIGGLSFTPDGEFLFYARGNEEAANPASRTVPPQQLIRVIELASGRDQAIGAGQQSLVSPDGEHVVIMRGGHPVLFEVDAARTLIDADEFTKHEPIFKDRGAIRNMAWSPDSRHIAFTSFRDDHSFVGVYELGSGDVTWLSPGVDFDSHPAWSPDSSRIAFFRTPGLRKDETRSVIESRDVALWVADIESGTGVAIWKPPVTNGFFAQDYPQQPLRWSATDRIVFYSEHEQWVHIYAINPDGSGLANLTPGACEAEHSTLSHDGSELIFSSNCRGTDAADIDRRHLWRSSLAGGKPEALTSGRSIETDPVVVGDDGLIAFRDAGVRRPAGIALLDSRSGKRTKVFPARMPDDYPAQQLVEPVSVVFDAADGVQVHGQLFRPAATGQQDKHKAVIFMHGGPIRQMLLGYHYFGEYYALTYAMNQYLASKGYVVLSVNFRSGIGYGRQFRLAEHQGPRGASEYQDIVAAGRYLQALDFVDADRIGLWGGSYGGYLTAMGLARDSDLFAAGVDFHGVHDWSWRGRDFGNDGWWSIADDLYPLALQSSPVAHVDRWSSPVLFIHGDDDRNVMFGQTIDIVQRLRDKGVTNEVLVFPNEVHSFLRYASWLRAFDATEQFLSRNLEQ